MRRNEQKMNFRFFTNRLKMRTPNRQFGFTLIELLLSLSILSIISVIILGALQIGVRAWEKGEHVLAVQQRSRTILDQLDRQLASASVLMGAQKEQPLVEFAGNSRSLEFTSSLPLITKIQFGPVHVKYVIETEPSGKKRDPSSFDIPAASPHVDRVDVDDEFDFFGARHSPVDFAPPGSFISAAMRILRNWVKNVLPLRTGCHNSSRWIPSSSVASSRSGPPPTNSPD